MGVGGRDSSGGGASRLDCMGSFTSSGFLSQLRTVLRDRPVRLAISCNDTLSRMYIRRILPNISMVITLHFPCPIFRQGK